MRRGEIQDPSQTGCGKFALGAFLAVLVTVGSVFTAVAQVI